jgi:hypothetical protein
MGALAGLRYRDVVKPLKALGLEFHRQAATGPVVMLSAA